MDLILGVRSHRCLMSSVICEGVLRLRNPTTLGRGAALVREFNFATRVYAYLLYNVEASRHGLRFSGKMKVKPKVRSEPESQERCHLT